jgi:hypothetical protein
VCEVEGEGRQSYQLKDIKQDGTHMPQCAAGIVLGSDATRSNMSLNVSQTSGISDFA